MQEENLEKTLYTCPMDPDVISDKPGACPKCGMDLVGVHSGHASMEKDFKRRFFISLPLVILVMLLSPNIQKWLGIFFDFEGKNFLMFIVGTFIYFFGGKPFFKAAKGEISTKNFGMMTLVALAITVGYAFSVAATFLFPGESLYWEISTLISVFLLGHWLEMRAVRGATGALAELAKLIPPTAHKISSGRLPHIANDARSTIPQNQPISRSLSERLSSSLNKNLNKDMTTFSSSASGQAPITVADVKTEELIKGDWVLVKPGEKIPIDGIVIDGESSVNESMITGESKPVGKKAKDKVIGGTINNDGSLTIEVTKIGSQTAVSQIMELIRQAQETKPAVQKLADRAANVLTLTAITVGAITFIFWFFVSPNGAIFATTLAVAVVVVACPHALGLAIPTVTTITSTLGAKNGILIKDMKGLEIARKVNYVVFDKTGTLTKGEFGVSRVVISSSLSLRAEGLNSFQDLERSEMPKQVRHDKERKESDLLQLAAAVEVYSQHSIAKGIVNEAQKRNLEIPKATNFKSYPGKGAEGIVNKKKVIVGNEALMKNFQPSTFNLQPSAVGTAVYVAIDKKLAGVILLSDVIREESKEAIDRLHQMGIKTAMLTGDKEDVAKEVGEKLDIDTVFAQVLPEDKVNKIKELQKRGNIVAMVGDGVNDAPSLTQAHVGIAIGAGTDVAVESAEIVLVKNDPRDVVKAISLSKKTNTKMIQNLVWATGYNLLAIPTAAGVFYPSFGILLRPEWAAILMSMSSIIVVFNALLLKRTKL